MAIRIPVDAHIVADQRLNLIRILSTLTAKKTGRLDRLKAAVKKSMAAKDATFAESDLVVARLSSGGEEKCFVDPQLLYALVKSKRITIEQFLDVICVRSSLLPEILSGAEIEQISEPAENAGDGDAGSLYTEFKADVKVDLDSIEKAILAAVAKEAA